MRRAVPVVFLPLLLAACHFGGGNGDEPKTPYDAYLREYAADVKGPWNRWKDAEWRTHTQVVPNDFTKAQQSVAAFEAWRDKAADPKWVRQARDLMREAESPSALKPTVEEQAGMDAIARTARLYPANDRELMTTIDDKAGLQARFRRRAEYKLDGEAVHPDELAQRYASETEEDKRVEIWRALVGPAADLKPGYAEVRDMRNDLARRGGWDDNLQAQLDTYHITGDELATLMSDIELGLRPLYQEIHTWARHELAAQYQVDPPDLIPAHWLPAALGEDWSGLVHVDGLEVDPALGDMGAKKMVRSIEDWYVSTGVPAFPATFWDRSSLLPVPPGARVGKTRGASTWDIDLKGDVRVLLSAQPTAGWMHASTREFAFAHAYLLRADAKIPEAIRQEPPRAMLGALGVWADLAASRPERLKKSGLITQMPDATRALLAEALLYVPFVEFGAGTAVPFEREVFAAALPPGQMNTRWWGLAAKHQGVIPPETRTERWADFLSIDALSDAPGRYVDYVLSVTLAFQLHDALCHKLALDPRTADLTGRKEFGDMFKAVATRADVDDWRKLTEELTEAPPSADAMVRYFQPLMAYLQAQNATRTPTLPSLR